MNKNIKTLGVVLALSICLVSCDKTPDSTANNNEVVEDKQVIINNEINNDNVENEVVEEINYEGFGFLNKDEAIEVLSTEDDYLIKLSKFDYASKFFSEVPLDKEGLINAYSKTVFEWSDDQKKVINDAMININSRLSLLNIDMPDVSFILTSAGDEGGAAYTRGLSIILKSHHVGTQTSAGLEELITHEMFHVYSRAHKDMRKEMYEVIGYKPCNELIIPEELVDYMISNPDAPDNNFYIEGSIDGTMYAFVPIIYSSEAYEIGSGRSFFETLNDDMLAVEIKDGVAEPIRINDELLIVEKSQIEGFYDKIGMNTDYTYHPEETMADNFVFLVQGNTVKSPWVVEGLKEVVSE